MMGSKRPRAIDGSGVGGGVKVILGSTGNDFLLILDKDDGNRRWQTQAWCLNDRRCNDLCWQLNACIRTGRNIDQVAMGPSGEWFVCGKYPDGTGELGWWGGSDAANEMKDWTCSYDQVQVSFGDYGRSVLIQGGNNYYCSGNCDRDLVRRIERICGNGGEIKRVRLLPDRGYWILDSEGSEWKGPVEHHAGFLHAQNVLDTAQAQDGSWIVWGPNRYIASEGISSKLLQHLDAFYREQKQWMTARLDAIAAFEREQARRAQEAAAARAREEVVARARRQEEEAAERRRAAEAAERERAAEEKRREEEQRRERAAEEKRRRDERLRSLLSSMQAAAESVESAPPPLLASLEAAAEDLLSRLQRKRRRLDGDGEDERQAKAARRPVPAAFKCPISKQMMLDPVMDTASGRVYERWAIEQWIRSRHTMPESRIRQLEPASSLRTQIQQYRAREGALGTGSAMPVSLGQGMCHVWRGQPGGPQFTISVLTRAHAKYAGVVAQFMSSWQREGAPKPRVRQVLQVRNSPHIYQNYERYKAKLGDEAGEVRRFHGTRMAAGCAFGMDESQPPCGPRSDCAVCNICAASFDVGRTGTGPNATNAVARALPAPGGLRYGRGIYFSKVSSKSDSYAVDSARRVRDAGPQRVMFLCKVLQGRVLRTSAPTLSQDEVEAKVVTFGRGGQYHSIAGEGAAEGGPLNFHELVVYKNRAAIPSYLIVYDVPAGEEATPSLRSAAPPRRLVAF